MTFTFVSVLRFFSRYKNWMLCSHDGYPYHISPYQGQEVNAQGPLGTGVVNSLCIVISKPENHEIYFDNLFTSIPLIQSLREKAIKAAGTLRSNRVLDCPVTKCDKLKKTERGTFEDGVMEILL